MDIDSKDDSAKTFQQNLLMTNKSVNVIFEQLTEYFADMDLSKSNTNPKILNKEREIEQIISVAS